MTLLDGQGDATLGRVLVVDDTEDVRFMIPLQLRTDGVRFAEAASGEEALLRCDEEQFDVVVLDYRMPGLSGMDVARELRARDYPASLILYSAYLEEQITIEAEALHMPFVDKADHPRLRSVVLAGIPAFAT